MIFIFIFTEICNHLYCVNILSRRLGTPDLGLEFTYLSNSLVIGGHATTNVSTTKIVEDAGFVNFTKAHSKKMPPPLNYVFIIFAFFSFCALAVSDFQCIYVLRSSQFGIMDVINTLSKNHASAWKVGNLFWSGLGGTFDSELQYGVAYV